MEAIWQDRFLNALLELDLAEGPHGLYGIRQAHVLKSGKLPTLAQVLVSDQRADFLRRLGMQGSGALYRPSELNLEPKPGERVELQVLDGASTKVRPYGSAHRLDTHHGKPETAPAWKMEKLVPKLGERTSRWRETTTRISQAILLVAHAPTLKSLQVFAGRTVEADFLARYQVRLDVRQWEDRYARDFWSGLYLWTPGRGEKRTE